MSNSLDELRKKIWPHLYARLSKTIMAEPFPSEQQIKTLMLIERHLFDRDGDMDGDDCLSGLELTDDTDAKSK